MKNSRSVFLIMCIVYLAIGSMGAFNAIEIGPNILLGLSLSALIMSISDIFTNVVSARNLYNEYGFMVQATVKFVDDKLEQNPFVNNPYVNIRNVKNGIELSHKHFEKSIHPSDYATNHLNWCISGISLTCFVCSIAIFILVPFIPSVMDDSFTVLITVVAFAAMCFNLFMTEVVTGLQNKESYFWNNSQLLVQVVYPDFPAHINQVLHYRADYIFQQQMQDKMLSEQGKEKQLESLPKVTRGETVDTLSGDN